MKYKVGQEGLTCCGKPAEIYAIKEGQAHAYLGAIQLSNGQWVPQYFREEEITCAPNERTVWVNVYEDRIGGEMSSFERANRARTSSRIALWRVTYDLDNPSIPPTVVVEWSKEQ